MLVFHSLSLTKLYSIVFSVVNWVAEHNFTCMKPFYLAGKATMRFALDISEQWYLMIGQPCSNEVSITLTADTKFQRKIIF